MRGFKRFCSKCFDGCQAQQVVVQTRTHIACGLAHFGVPRGQALLKPKCAKQNHRNRQERDQGNAGLQRKKHGADHQGRTKHLDDLVGSAVQETFHLVDIVVQNRHQVAGALVFKIRHVQFLNVAVGVQTQIVLNVLRQLAPLHFVEVLKQRFAPPNHHVQCAQRQQLVPGTGNADSAQHIAG